MNFNRNTFNVSNLFNFKIIVEKPRPRKARGYPQCKRCQSHLWAYVEILWSPSSLREMWPRIISLKNASSHVICRQNALAITLPTSRLARRIKSSLCPKTRKPALRSNNSTNVQSPPKVSSNEVPGDHSRQLSKKSYAAATKTVTSSMESVSNFLSEFISNFNTLITPLVILLTEFINKRICP
ncbi:unnamed protein product [Macrosiphum euphorbiae]|uniref:Uncharacterized protein n=1 Tax=Macrosiphum euphorbiae TaxID=13131 RepID=A0AAV0X196_9HEMI|nr:unnamed protein product [Macrosiphum euphorbiae]